MALPLSRLAEMAGQGHGNCGRADKPDQSIDDGRALPAPYEFKRDRPTQSLLVPPSESTIGPAELLFGRALTGKSFRWNRTLSIDSTHPLIAEISRRCVL